MGKIAFVFPGQSAQYVGMAREIAEQSSSCRELLEAADARLGYKLSELMFEGPAEALTLTENAQPALVAASMVCYKLLKEAGIVPEMVAGHSLGEYAALAAAGALSAEDAIWLVRQRGLYMAAAVPAGAGSMAAVLGASQEQVRELCAYAAQFGLLEIANYNCPGQIVISGEKSALDAAVAKAKEYGAKKAMPLAVSGPFHSSLLTGAGERLAEAIDQVTIQAPQLTVIANYSALPVRTPEEIKRSLIDQVSHPVRWEESVRWMVNNGVDTIVEVGAGKVLTGLTKRIAPDVKLFNVENMESFAATAAALS